jgi:hypothetical protein
MAQLQATTVDGTINSLRTENVQTNNYILALSDSGLVVAMNNAAAATVTVPNDSTVNFPIGSLVYVNRLNSGTVTIQAAGGVTILGLTVAQLDPLIEIGLRKRAANVWTYLRVF